jgi:hypothetical protein
MGIGAPADLSKQLTAAQQEFQQRLDPVKATLRQMGYDIYDPENRGDAQLKLAWASRQGMALIDAINSGEWRNDPALTRQLLAQAEEVIGVVPGSGSVIWPGWLPGKEIRSAVPMGNQDLLPGHTDLVTALPNLVAAVQSANGTLANLQWLAPRVNSELMNALRGR